VQKSTPRRASVVIRQSGSDKKIAAAEATAISVQP
jgi:hypothetical protein